jgi:hypothetical protein
VRDQLGEFSAMPLPMDVASGHSPLRRALPAAQARHSQFGDAMNFPFPMLGDGLGLVDLGEAFRAPLHSDVPTLFVSGSLDGRTPPANVLGLLSGFRNGTHLQVRTASHDDELWLGNPGVAARVADFLAGRPVNDAVLEVPPPAFATSNTDVLLLALGVSRGMAFAALATFAALPLVVYALWRRRRRKLRMRDGRECPTAA